MASFTVTLFTCLLHLPSSSNAFILENMDRKHKLNVLASFSLMSVALISSRCQTNTPPWTHLFIRDPLWLVQGEGTVEGSVLRHHAEAAGAPDEFLSVGNCRHSASAAVSLLWTGRILSTTNYWACTPFAMTDREHDESDHSVHITCVGVCFDSCSPHEGGTSNSVWHVTLFFLISDTQ